MPSLKVTGEKPSAVIFLCTRHHFSSNEAVAISANQNEVLQCKINSANQGVAEYIILYLMPLEYLLLDNMQITLAILSEIINSKKQVTYNAV